MRGDELEVRVYINRRLKKKRGRACVAGVKSPKKNVGMEGRPVQAAGHLPVAGFLVPVPRAMHRVSRVRYLSVAVHRPGLYGGVRGDIYGQRQEARGLLPDDVKCL